jgi:hypothetical protein
MFKMATSEDVQSCGVCKKVLKTTDVVLFCGLWCDKSFHNECVGVSNSEARTVACSKDRIKFHCQCCEMRLRDETFRVSEVRKVKTDKEEKSDVKLLKYLQNILTVANKLSNDNISMTKKLDTIISANSRIEELQSPKHNVHICEKLPVNRFESLESEYDEISESVQEKNGSVNSREMALAADKHRPTHHIVNNVLCNPTHSSTQENGADECCKNVSNDSNPVTQRGNTIGPTENSEQTEIPYSEIMSAKQVGLIKYPESNYDAEMCNKKVGLKNSKNGIITGNISKSDDTNGAWQQVRYKKKRPVKSSPSSETNNVRPAKTIVGSGNKLGLYGEKRAWFHLSKIKSGTTVELVTKYLESTFPEHKDFVVEKLETKGLNYSFKIGVDFELKNKVMNPEIWPKNVAIRRFLFQKKHNQPDR